MRLLCLHFPRLAIQLLRRSRPDLAGVPVVLVAGDGDNALVAALSAELSASGVMPGMLAAAARARCSRASFLSDNAGDCLATLEAVASILRLRATPAVVIASREHLFVDLAGLDERFPDEESAAAGIATLVRSWIGLDVRAGVGPTRDSALAAAHSALRQPVVVPVGDAPTERLAVSPEPAIAARAEWTIPSGPIAVRARLARVLATFETVLATRSESFRQVRLSLADVSGSERILTIASHEPLHHAAEALALLAGQLDDVALLGVVAVRMCLERIGPSVRVEPVCAGGLVRRTGAPAVPFQHSLLRAS
jgi:impB/mucB/samB family